MPSERSLRYSRRAYIADRTYLKDRLIVQLRADITDLEIELANVTCRLYREEDRSRRIKRIAKAGICVVLCAYCFCGWVLS